MLFLFTIFFIILCLRHLKLGLFFCLLLLPTYLLRLNIFSIPTTVLEIMIGVITLVWLIKFNKKIVPVLHKIVKNNKWLLILTGLFLLSATASIFFSPDPISALGEWKAWFIEPVILMMIIITYPKLVNIKKTNDYINYLIFALTLSGFLTAVFATIQHFTGYMVPWEFWENGNSYRVTGWYGYPNGVGLYLAPILILSYYLVHYNWQKINTEDTIARGLTTILRKIINTITNRGSASCSKENKKYFLVLLVTLISIPLMLLAVIYAKSTGALVAVVGSTFILGIMCKKTRWCFVNFASICLIIFLLLPSTEPIKHEVLMQDRSGQIRLAMWSEAIKMLQDNPIFGAGMNGYQTAITPYHTTVNGEGIEIFHHPHNLYLSMWSNIGIMGLILFITLIMILAKKTIKLKKYLSLIILGGLLAILIHGLVDTPYFKNDLAIVFWFMVSLVFLNQKASQTTAHET